MPLNLTVVMVYAIIHTCGHLVGMSQLLEFYGLCPSGHSLRIHLLALHGVCSLVS